ncbi:hypothetical protein [Capillimicrobium parvum]|uniref:hypothetical protein n=1 Tax=Capillimicrobium parvum TaxID=2884022 RepID=UPI00216B6484|nr:hypothetical protein [Capillimicrobium parvum]
MVGIVPAAAFAARPRLLAALECALPVRFEPREPGDADGLDGLVRVGVEAPPPPGRPCLDAAADERPDGGRPVPVRLEPGAGLDARLCGATLTDGPAATVAPLRLTGPAMPMARRGDDVLWARGVGRCERVAMAPCELAAHETLRHRLVPGRCLGLLALVHFLRGVCSGALWSPPPLRAAFILDDPNLHWPTYGHVDFAELAGDAERHGYHVAMATTPLDGWFAHPRACGVFRRHDRRLSLLVHGRLHHGPELGRLRDPAAATSWAHDALHRVARLERRAGLRIARVMAPPHERLSEAAAVGLMAGGFEAVTMSRPYPWVEGDWLAQPAGGGPLVGWETTDQVAGGLPVLLRNGFDHPREDLVLRAFLDQPLVLYGHQQELAGGLDRLREAAAQINALGPVRWGSMECLARRSFDTRRDGARMFVRLSARCARVEVPDGVRELVVSHSAGAWEPRAVPFEGPGVAELSIGARMPPGDRLRAPVAAIVRRIVTEGRDRIAPLRAAGTRALARPRPRPG